MFSLAQCGKDIILDVLGVCSFLSNKPIELMSDSISMPCKCDDAQ